MIPDWERAQLEATIPFALVAGTGSRELANAVARELDVHLAACAITRFPDGEVSVQLGESVRGREVFLLAATAPPVNDHLVELLILADTCRRAAAARLIAVIPYFGYARSDKRQSERVPITASTVADLMQSVGIGHVVTVDVHTPQIEGFFRIPVDVLTAVPLLCDAVRPTIPVDAVVVAPDLGAVRRATEFARRLDLPVAACHKRRVSGAAVEVTQVTGDVDRRPCLIVDDMITTGATIVESIRALSNAGARPEFRVSATHGVLVADARDRLAAAGVSELYLTDTVAGSAAALPPTHLISVAPLLAEAIRRIAAGASLRDLVQ